MTLVLLLELAGLLHARVRGDELETYRTADETYVHPDDRAELAAVKRATSDILRQARARRLRRDAILIGVFLLICLVVAWTSRR